MGDKNPGVIAEHPLLSKLVAGNAMSLRGYVGPSSAEHVRLYPSLDDLSESVEISKGDIIHSEASDSASSGGTVIWLKRDSEVTYYRVESVRTAAQRLPHSFTRVDKTDPRADVATGDLVEVNRGRLRMLVRRLNDDSCQSRCQVCVSRCQVCQSRCAVCHSRFEGPGIQNIRGNLGAFFGNAGRFRSR